jgi:hypothetical protein
MAIQAIVGVEPHAAEHEGAAGDETMDIITMADSVGHRNSVLKGR